MYDPHPHIHPDADADANANKVDSNSPPLNDNDSPKNWPEMTMINLHDIETGSSKNRILKSFETLNGVLGIDFSTLINFFMHNADVLDNINLKDSFYRGIFTHLLLFNLKDLFKRLLNNQDQVQILLEGEQLESAIKPSLTLVKEIIESYDDGKALLDDDTYKWDIFTTLKSTELMNNPEFSDLVKKFEKLQIYSVEETDIPLLQLTNGIRHVAKDFRKYNRLFPNYQEMVKFKDEFTKGNQDISFYHSADLQRRIVEMGIIFFQNQTIHIL